MSNSDIIRKERRAQRKKFIEECEAVFERGSKARIAKKYQQSLKEKGSDVKDRSAYQVIVNAATSLRVGDSVSMEIINLYKEEAEFMKGLYTIEI